MNDKIRLPAGDGRVGFVDARDVAVVAATVLTRPGHDGRAYELTGPRACSHAELAAALSVATARDILYEPLSSEAYASELAARGWSPRSIESMCLLFADMRAGGAAGLSGDVEAVTGRPALGIAEFARDHAHLFQCQAG